MSCAVCSKTYPLPQSTSLVIGTLEASTDYYIYFKRMCGSRTERLSATSASNSSLTVNISTLSNFLRSHCEFEVWVTKQSATEIYEREVITIGEDYAMCLLQKWEIVQGNSYTSQSIKLI